MQAQAESVLPKALLTPVTCHFQAGSPEPVCVSVQHKEPRGPRPICDLLIEKLATAEAEVVQLVRESGQITPQNARGHRSAASVRYSALAGQLLQTVNSSAENM